MVDQMVECSAATWVEAWVHPTADYTAGWTVDPWVVSMVAQTVD